MQFSSTILLTLATALLAQPVANNHHSHHNNQQLDKRAYVTNLVHATQLLYQNEVVYVDNEGAPWSTGVEPVSTVVNVEDSNPTTAPAQTTEVQQPSTTTTQQQPQSTQQQQDPVQQQQEQIQKQSEQNKQQPTQNTPASSQQAPSPTSSTEQAQWTPPASTTQQQVQSSSSSSSAPSSSSSSDSGSDDSGSGSGETFKGDATYYTPGLGACGETSSESDYIVALNSPQFHQSSSSSSGGNSNYNTFCGKKVEITKGGKSVKATVVDLCPSCDHGSLDLSPAAFEKIADKSEGRVKVSWQFVN